MTDFWLQFSQQLFNGLSLGAIYALIAIGYTMVYGIIGMINFAHGEIYMIGAYTGLITLSIIGVDSALPLFMVIALMLIAAVFTGLAGVIAVCLALVALGVVVGIVLAGLTGWLWLDPLVAIGVALNIVREGARLIWRSAQGLMDTAAEPEVLAQIDGVLETFTRYHGEHAVVRFDHIATRKSGQRRFVNFHMHLPPNWTLHRAAQLRGRVERELVAAVPRLYVNIEMLPDGVEPLLTDIMEAAEPDPASEVAGPGAAH